MKVKFSDFPGVDAGRYRCGSGKAKPLHQGADGSVPLQSFSEVERPDHAQENAEGYCTSAGQGGFQNLLKLKVISFQML